MLVPNIFISILSTFASIYNCSSKCEFDSYLIKYGKNYSENEYWKRLDIYTDNRDDIIGILKTHSIQTRKTYGTINKTKVYYSDIILPNSEYVSKNGIFLPSFITLTDPEILYICKILITSKLGL